MAYIKGWLKRLKDDKRFILIASAKAQRAVDFILNIKRDELETSQEGIEVLVEFLH